MSIKDLVSNIKHNGLRTSMAQLEELYKLAIENEEMLAVSQREFRAADATIENLQMQVEKLAAENAGLKGDVPLGAIENGRAFADRLENYQFECEGGNLNMCSDWQEFRRCFEYLSEWAMHGQPETPTHDAFLAEVRAQGVEMFASELGNVHKQLRSGSNHARAIKSAVFRAVEFAAQLRKGVQS